MPITDAESAFVAATTESISLAQMFTVTTSTSNPTYLVVSALDRNEYSVASTGATGSFTGNGHKLAFTNQGSDGRGADIIFTYQASTGQYYNSTYGYFNQLVYNSSSSPYDVTNISVYGTNSLMTVMAYASNAWNLMYYGESAYIGSATVVTEPKYTAKVPTQATPDSIAAAADSFVGQAWNMNGCWTLASTIAAEAGTSLPVQSTEIGVSGVANGEWIVAFNGPGGQTGNWQSMVTAGEMIVFLTSGGTGHITTCVSGSGSSAMLVDNITYLNANGTVANSAKDGSSADVTISSPHAASQEFAGVSASEVVIYELDTPVIADAQSAADLSYGGTLSLASLFKASDPAGKAITGWQVYDTAATDSLSSGGTIYAAHSVASALAVASLSTVSLHAGSSATTDTLEVRAYNGSYWGDWQTLSVVVGATAASPPVLAKQTASQSWLAGKSTSFALPAGTFIDPQNEALTFAAMLSNGQALPSWLTFNAASGTFSGTPPATAETLAITVKATDTSQLSASETFNLTVIAPPTITQQTANQTWTEGSKISLTLANSTFTDPQNEKLTYTATQANGQALPSWLTFNAATEAFSGTAPNAVTSLSIKVTATDSSGLSVAETFTGAVTAAPTTPKYGITVTNPPPGQSWTDGQKVALTLPSNTFTDADKLKMTFTAYQLSGPTVTSWLYFNATNDELYGTVPNNATGTVGLEVIARDSLGYVAADMFTVTLGPSTGHVAGLTAAASSSVAAVPMQPTLIALLHTT